MMMWYGDVTPMHTCLTYLHGFAYRSEVKLNLGYKLMWLVTWSSRGRVLVKKSILDRNSPRKWSCDPFPVWFFILYNFRIVTRVLFNNITIKFKCVLKCLLVSFGVFQSLWSNLKSSVIFCHHLSSLDISGEFHIWEFLTVSLMTGPFFLMYCFWDLKR